jgi:uncharacterized membrane protein YcaP (DUF421 family)
MGISMWFNGWGSVGRVALFTVLGYAVMLLLVRLAGKRSISKKNAADFIITVSVGSAISTMILSKDVTLAEGCTALFVFMLIQYLVVTLSTRSKLAQHIVESQPVVLLFEGRVIEQALLAEEVNDTELLAAVRNAGCGGLEEVYAVVLESDGSFSVIRSRPKNASAMRGVKGLR